MILPEASVLSKCESRQWRTMTPGLQEVTAPGQEIVQHMTLVKVRASWHQFPHLTIGKKVDKHISHDVELFFFIFILMYTLSTTFCCFYTFRDVFVPLDGPKIGVSLFPVAKLS